MESHSSPIKGPLGVFEMTRRYTGILQLVTLKSCQKQIHMCNLVTWSHSSPIRTLKDPRINLVVKLHGLVSKCISIVLFLGKGS